MNSKRRIVVLGSSSLLAPFPELGETNGPLEISYDADLLVDGIDEQLAAVFDEAIGKESLFEAIEGYHADTLKPVVAETFPAGWEDRLVPLPGCEGVFCLDPHDLGAIKIGVGWMKDLELCAVLVATKRLDAGALTNGTRQFRENRNGSPRPELFQGVRTSSSTFIAALCPGIPLTAPPR